MNVFILSKRVGLAFGAISSHSSSEDAWEAAGRSLSHEQLHRHGIDPSIAYVAAKTWSAITSNKEEFRVDSIPHYGTDETDPVDYLIGYARKLKPHQLDQAISEAYDGATTESQIRFLYELCGRSEQAVRQAIQKIIAR